jgi:hypothetical protein
MGIYKKKQKTMVLRETVASIFLASGFFREPIPHGLLRHTLNFFEVFFLILSLFTAE